MKRTIILGLILFSIFTFLPLASAVNNVTEFTTNLPSTSAGDSASSGIIIQAMYNLNLTRIQKDALVTATNATLKYINGTIIARSIYVGDFASFPNIQLTKGNYYIIESNTTGGTYTSARNSSFFSIIERTNIRIINGSNDAVNTSQLINIVNVTTSINDNSSSVFNEPIDNFISMNATTFNGTIFVDNQYSINNLTLYLWYNNGSLFRTNSTTLTGTISNTATWIMNGLGLQGYHWNILACGNKSTTVECQFRILNRTMYSGIANISTNFITTVYETETSYFNVTFNISSGTPTGRFWWNSTSYTATATNILGNMWRLATNLDIPIGIGNKGIFWEINVNNLNYNTSIESQNSTAINLTLCSTTPQNVAFINFTFKNETASQESVSASIPSSTWSYWLGNGIINKSLSFSNNSQNFNYSFCFNPPHRSVFTELSLSYDNSESEQRTYSPATLSLTNTSTLTTLFLLPSGSGQYVTFQVINTAQQALEGVSVIASRSGIGTIETGTTDSSGSVTFFLNPNFAYSFVFSKTGFDDFTTTITPTQTSYTITMGGGSGSTNSTNSAKGMSFVILPSQKTLSNGTTYNFNLTLNSSFWSLDSWGFTLQNRSGYVFASQSSSTSSGGFLSNNLNTGENKTIVMNYFWVINGVYNNATTTWGIVDLSGNSLSIYQFFTDLRSYVTLGFFGLDDVGLGVITFFAIFLVTGVMSYKFGINSPASIMAFIFSLTLFFDVGLGLVPNPIGAIPHAPTFFIGIIMIALIFREMGR